MTIDGISQSTGADRVVTVEAAGAAVSVVVSERAENVEIGRAIIPIDGLMAVLIERPVGPQSVAQDVGVEVRRNEVWLIVGGADAAVGLDDLMDAVAAANPSV